MELVPLSPSGEFCLLNQQGIRDQGVLNKLKVCLIEKAL